MKAINKESNIYWLTSYPKSGNTWVRVFIANLLNENPNEAVNINELFTGSIASSREWVGAACGFDISELSHDEIDNLRADAYKWHAINLKDIEYHKCHDAYTMLRSGQPMFPKSATRGALCIIRNPLDVAISLANHNYCSIDTAIDSLNNPNYMFCGSTKKMHNQLRQKLLTWSGYVTSWADAKDIKVKVVRYEDMLHTPEATFSKIAKFLELPTDKSLIKKALHLSTMEQLQKQEREQVFKEKPGRTEKFFRKGIVGDWQDTLSEYQVKKIISAHHQTMQRFGYLDSNCKPTNIISKYPSHDRK